MVGAPGGGDPPKSPAVARVIDILDWIGEHPGATVSEIASALELPKSSVSNLCHDLCSKSVLRRDGPGHWLSAWSLGLAAAYLRSSDLVSVFTRTVRMDPDARPETVQLARLDGTDMVYLARHDGAHAVRLVSEIGRKLPASCTATGKTVLAELDDRTIAALYEEQQLPRLTQHSHATVPSLLEDLRRVRELGYAVDEQETTEGVICVAAPVREFSHTAATAAISISVFEARATAAVREQLTATVKHLARQLSAELGGSSAGSSR
jgi:IclR family transcriptional regulator, blcABC operon repressor